MASKRWTGPLIDAGPTRAHLWWLIEEQGVTAAAIGRQLKVHTSDITWTAYGRSNRKPPKRVREDFAAAILAIRDDGGMSKLVDPAKAREHLRQLVEAGADLIAIAEQVGSRSDHLKDLLEGTERASAQIRVTFERAILAVQSVGPRVAGGFSAVGPTRRVQALSWMRWHRDDIAARSGVDVWTVGALLRGDLSVVKRATYHRLRRFYDAHRHLDGKSARARRYAVEHQFHGPDAWTADTIDDPAAQPRPVTTVPPALLEAWYANPRYVGVQPGTRVDALPVRAHIHRLLRMPRPLTLRQIGERSGLGRLTVVRIYRDHLGRRQGRPLQTVPVEWARAIRAIPAASVRQRQYGDGLTVGHTAIRWNVAA